MPADAVEFQPRPDAFGQQDSHMQAEDEQHQGQHQQDGGTAQPPTKLTPALEAGAQGLHNRADDIFAQLDELERAVIEFIEHLKETFVSRMHEARLQIRDFQSATMQEWAQQSEATIHLDDRLRTAQQLVGSLEASFGGT